MKKIVTLFLLLSISLIHNAQTNYALYSLENVFPVCESSNNQSFYGISWKDNVAQLKSYNLATGYVISEFNITLPENPIVLMFDHPDKEILYLISSRKTNDTEERYIDAIYSLNTKKNRLTLLRKVYYDYKIPNKIGIVGNDLVLTTLQEPTYLFSLKSNDFRLLNPNTDYQLLSIAPKQNGYLMLNIRKRFNGHIPVFFMDQENNFSPRIGYITPKITIETEITVIPLSTITLEDSSYNWIIEPIRYNCFPIYNFQISMYPFWLKQAYTLDKAFSLSGILFANNTYMMTRSASSIVAYNYAKPDNKTPANFNDEDIANLQKYLNERIELDIKLVEQESLNEIFNALFYEVYSTNQFKYMAVQQHGSYSELKEYAQLIPILKPEFKLSDEKNAQLLQDALTILFPIDDYNKKYLQNYKTDKGWIFVRGEAFGNKVGLLVKMNEDSQITEIEYKSEL